MANFQKSYVEKVANTSIIVTGVCIYKYSQAQGFLAIHTVHRGFCGQGLVRRVGISTLGSRLGFWLLNK
jgi:hypothetical protein